MILRSSPCGIGGEGSSVGSRTASGAESPDAGGDPPAQEEGTSSALPRRDPADPLDGMVARQPVLRDPARGLDGGAPRPRADAGPARRCALRALALWHVVRGS